MAYTLLNILSSFNSFRGTSAILISCIGPEFQGPLTSLRLERETEKNTKAYADSLPVPDSVALGTAFITMDDLTLAGSSRTRHGSNVPRGGGYDIGSS